MTNEAFEKGRLVKNKIQYAYTASSYWSSSEYNQNNAWNVNFNSSALNNNNKNNTNNVVRPVAALDEKRKEAWIDAYDNCCRHKKTSDNCIRYRLDYEEDLFRLAYEVETGTYKPSTSVCFCVTRPKLREVFAANFRDRIVHHWLIMKLNPLFEKRFVEQGNVSFNCRKGFGVQSAVNALRDDIKAVSKDYSDDAYVGRFDLVGFFMSIDKDILIDSLRTFVYDNYKETDVDLVFETLCIVIRHNPAMDCEIHGNAKLFKDLPRNKSLFYAEDNKGLPIGNLTSQILANFYLSYFDEVMVEWASRRGGRYERFVDDFVVVMPKMKMVYEAYLFSREYLADELKLRLHDDKKYTQHYTKGIAFVGYVVKIDRIYLSNRTFGHFEDKMRYVDRVCENIDSKKMDVPDFMLLNGLLQSINSYTGFSANASGYAKRMKILCKYKKMYNFAYFKNERHTIKIRKQFKIGEILYAKDRMERAGMSSCLHHEAQRRTAATNAVRGRGASRNGGREHGMESR